MSFSLKPDPWTAWIYDPRHPEYNSERAKDLRNKRAAAIASAPTWMYQEAYLNDMLKKHKS